MWAKLGVFWKLAQKFGPKLAQLQSIDLFMLIKVYFASQNNIYVLNVINLIQESNLKAINIKQNSLLIWLKW